MAYICEKRKQQNRQKEKEKHAQSAGFEPARAEPNGFLVHRLNHSATTAMTSEGFKQGQYHFVLRFYCFMHIKPNVHRFPLPLKCLIFFVNCCLLPKKPKATPCLHIFCYIQRCSSKRCAGRLAQLVRASC